MQDTDKIVLIVHSVDTEGPLYESLDASFGRLRDLFGVDGLPRTKETLRKLQNAEIDLGGKERSIAEVFNAHLGQYNETWDDVDAMLDRVMSREFRMRRPDSYGGGWIYNWHCLDHVGYVENPRRRDMGYHNIFDHYAERIAADPDCRDRLQFHFHPMSTYHEAHRCATSYVNSPELYQILCRRIIERQWFPSVFRAGFQTERPDSNWFLEQWIPYDISNMAIDDPSELENTIDFRNGRSGDWRLAASDWSVYRPHHDNYQLPGDCRRYIARCLNVLNRIASIDQREMDKAFARADEGQPTLVGVTGHDFRDLGREVEHVTELAHAAAKKYPEVKFKYCEAVEGFRRATGVAETEIDPVSLDIRLDRAPTDDVPNLEVRTARGKVFGPQPFLAIETMSRRYIHDNFDFSREGDRWFYAFHTDTLPLSDVRRIGVATNDAAGNTFVQVIDVNV